MELVGFIVSVVVASYASVGIYFVIAHGGEEFSPLPLRQYYWAIPMVLALIFGWYIVCTNAPFSVVAA